MNTPLRDVVTSPQRREAYLRAGHWDDATLSGRVAHWAARKPDGTSVVDDGGARRHSWAELHGDAQRLAAHLGAHGVGAGDVVSVQLPNRYETVVSAVAIQALGAIVNPLLPNYRRRELVHVFATARPRAWITPAVYRGFDHCQLAREVMQETDQRVLQLVVGDAATSGVAWEEALASSAEPPPPRRVPAEGVSELIFTSGTEAAPKAIMHTEQTACFSVRVARADLGIGERDVVWMPSPLGHSTGFNYGLRFALYHGLVLVLQDPWDAEVAVELIERERCSYTLAATTFLQDLLAASERRPDALRSLQFFGCGGAPVPPDLVEAADARGMRVLRLYGSTEVLVGTWNRPGSSLERRMHTDGAPMRHVEIECRREDGRACEPDEPGEAFIRGPNTSVGFFDDPQRTAQTFDADGWVRSGDLVRLSARGDLTVVGRKKEIIIRGGMNIAPREIEELILQLPEVERAAVVGFPDPRLGERACACLVLRSAQTLELDQLTQRLSGAGLAKYKLPERLEIFDALPATASGKIQKHVIAAELERRTSAPRAGGT